MSSLQSPTFTSRYTLGPLPGVALATQPLRFLILDAATVDNCSQWFPESAGKLPYARLRAFSSAGTGRRTIFVISPVEAEVLDAYKGLFRHPGTKHWARGSRGKGMDKSYNEMRSWSFIDQHLMVPIGDLKDRHVGAAREDIPDNPVLVPCPASDTDRNDVRLLSILESAQAIRRVHHNAELRFYLGGDRIAGRYNDLLSIPNSVPSQIAALGVVVLSISVRRLPNHVDSCHGVLATNVVTQPQHHPLVSPNAPFEFTDLAQVGIHHKITPTSVPRHPVPNVIQPLPGWIIRVIADSNIHSHWRHELVALVHLSQGDTELACIPEIERELSALVGSNPVSAGIREKSLRRLMGLKPSRWYTMMENAMIDVGTWFFGPDQPPTFGPMPTGDIRIRSQLASVIEEVENNFLGTKKPVILFLTNDYNCELLVRSIPTTSAIFIVLRLDGNEKSNHALRIIWNVIRQYCM